MKRVAIMAVFAAVPLAGCHIAWIDDPVWGPGGTEVQGRCTQWEHLIEANDLPVDQFSRVMYRESRCNPGARNSSSGAAGLLQIMPQWITRWGICDDFSRSAGGCSVSALYDPGWNIYYAKKIYDIQGGRAWSTW